MPRLTLFVLSAALLLAASPPPTVPPASVRASLARDLNQYLMLRAKPEHISGVSLSISFHGSPQTLDVSAGTTRYGGLGRPMTSETLWQIGSNTKAFTAAIILQLEAEGKLSINQTVGRWLPEYPAWKNVTIRRLLDMTSGIPSYDNSNAWLKAYASDPNRHFTLKELIAYVYPTTPGALPPTHGYSYSNTNYLLSELIVQRVTGNTYAAELDRRFLRAHLDLDSTYYAAFDYPLSIRERTASGYFFNHDPENAALAPLLGRDMRDASVSWMQAAGGIVSTPEDLIDWARALYTGDILAPKQRAELLSLVSLKTGKPIIKTSLDDPRGFGLGVAQLTTPETGTVWYYEGMTLGYRMVHVYFPRQDAVIALGLNSSPDSKEDRVGNLVTTIYNTLHAAGRL